MADGRAIIESSDIDGVLEIIQDLKETFHHVSATAPVQTHDGRYISSVRYSNETTIIEMRK